MSEEDRISLARLEEKVNGWMDSTTEYRRNLTEKIDNLMSKFSHLPCKERGLGTKLMWGAIGVIGTLLFIHLGWK